MYKGRLFEPSSKLNHVPTIQEQMEPLLNIVSRVGYLNLQQIKFVVNHKVFLFVWIVMYFPVLIKKNSISCVTVVMGILLCKVKFINGLFFFFVFKLNDQEVTNIKLVYFKQKGKPKSRIKKKLIPIQRRRSSTNALCSTSTSKDNVITC